PDRDHQRVAAAARDGGGDGGEAREGEERRHVRVATRGGGLPRHELEQGVGVADERHGPARYEQPLRAARVADHELDDRRVAHEVDRKSTRLNSSHGSISYAVFCLKKKKKNL